MDYISVRVSDIIKKINRDLYLPAIQREFVWEPYKVERLFDSIMAAFPIGTFLYWNLKEEHKNDWPIYEFIRDFDTDSPHNQSANMAGITKDIDLVLDGQQRITSLFIGLRGSYRYFFYRWRTTKLYLDLLKEPVGSEDNPEELTYGFAFRESSEPDRDTSQLWYLVGRILDFEDAEDAKADMEEELAKLPSKERGDANRLIGRLHSRIHTISVGNYYLEKSQDYEKVLQIFVRTNTAGKPLEYSDMLLSTATAEWETLDARSEIHSLTDSLNEIGSGYQFGKDFVLKASLYLSENLPIQYKVKNFTRTNLRIIEDNWDTIKKSLSLTVRLISKFGFNSKNVVAPLALLPIAFYVMKRENSSFDISSEAIDVKAQIAIRRWFIFSTLNNAFGGSSDTTLTRLRELLKACGPTTSFPADTLYKSLDIEPRFSDDEIENLFGYKYQGRYTNLILALLYPDRNWKDAVFHQDHIFPRSEFQRSVLRRYGYDKDKIESYISKCDDILNLQLLTDAENMSKNATPFEQWIQTRDPDFKKRHLIPDIPNYSLDLFEEFLNARKALILKELKEL